MAGHGSIVLVAFALIASSAVAGCVRVPGPFVNETEGPAPDAWRTNTTTPVPPTPSETPPWYEGDWRPYPTQSTTATPTPTPATHEFENVLVLRYVAQTLDDHSGEFYGRHCADAILQDDHIKVLDGYYDAFLREHIRTLLIVQPGIEGNWSTTGRGGFPMVMPAKVPSHIYGHGSEWANITWNETHDRALVDGDEVALPYAWNVTADDGTWRIDAVLDHGPTRVESFRREGCI